MFGSKSKANAKHFQEKYETAQERLDLLDGCLLYTSDAADD